MNQRAEAGTGRSSFLTYEPFFGLKAKPFSLACDPAFFYKSAAHDAAFDALDAGIRRREKLIVLSGEVGTGKTTLCRAVLSQLDHTAFSAFVPDPSVTREDLLKTLLVGFGIASVTDLNDGPLQGASRQDLSGPLYEFLDSLVPRQAFAVLVIDEAQSLSLGVMEEIRILVERRETLLQIVLVGQPQLRDTLRLPQMRPLEQRVTVRCELAPLACADVTAYVHHRLAVAAVEPGGVAITAGALEAVHLASGGVPRLINLVCDRALERGFESRRRTIDPDTIAGAVRDLGLGEPRVTADTAAAAGVVPVPCATALDAEEAFHSEQTLSVADPTRSIRHELAGGTAAFAPEAFAGPAPAPADLLAEFGTEPTRIATPQAPRPVVEFAPRGVIEPAPLGLFFTLARSFGLAAGALGIAVGLGAFYSGAVLDAVAPNNVPLLPTAPAAPPGVEASALPVPDALTAALTDDRARAPDAYAVQIATFADPRDADDLVGELVAEGYRASWAEVRSNGSTARQQVSVNAFGTLEEALGVVTRLRRRASSADATLTRLPGAMRRGSAGGR